MSFYSITKQPCRRPLKDGKRYQSESPKFTMAFQNSINDLRLLVKDGHKDHRNIQTLFTGKMTNNEVPSTSHRCTQLMLHEETTEHGFYGLYVERFVISR